MNRIQTDEFSSRTTSDEVFGQLPSPSPTTIRNHRALQSKGDDTPKLKRSRLQYLKRKLAGLCAFAGCPAKAEVGHTRCAKHLVLMCQKQKAQYESRVRESLCVYCGERPGFWGLRCIICRQRFSKDPLPLGARRALRLYRKAEAERDLEHAQVEARLAARKLLATGDITGKRARALRLYTGIEDGKWRTYKEVGQVMGITSQAVSQLLLPSKIVLERILADRSPETGFPKR